MIFKQKILIIIKFGSVKKIITYLGAKNPPTRLKGNPRIYIDLLCRTKTDAKIYINTKYTFYIKRMDERNTPHKFWINQPGQDLLQRSNTYLRGGAKCLCY